MSMFLGILFSFSHFPDLIPSQITTQIYIMGPISPELQALISNLLLNFSNWKTHRHFNFNFPTLNSWSSPLPTIPSLQTRFFSVFPLFRNNIITHPVAQARYLVSAVFDSSFSTITQHQIGHQILHPKYALLFPCLSIAFVSLLI